MSAHVTSEMRVVDLSLLRSAEALDDLSSTELRNTGRFRQALAISAGVADANFWVIFLDPSGNGVAASNNLAIAGVSYADRPYFKERAGACDRGLYVGAPEVGRVSKRKLFFLSRAVCAPNGSFLGVVVAPVDASALASVFSSARFQPTLSISRGTVHRLLREWEASQQQSIVPSAVLPAPIQAALLKLIGEEKSPATLPLTEKLAESGQAADGLARENERLADAIAELREEAMALQSELANGEGRFASLEAELAEARETAARKRQAAEAARTDLAKAQLRLEGVPAIQQELTDARALVELERERRIAAEQNHAIAIAQRDSLDSRLVESKEQLTEAKAHDERTMKSLQLERDEVRRLGQSVADLRVAAESAHRDALEAKAESERVSSELNLLKEATAVKPATAEGGSAEDKPVAAGQGKEKPPLKDRA